MPRSSSPARRKISLRFVVSLKRAHGIPERGPAERSMKIEYCRSAPELHEQTPSGAQAAAPETSMGLFRSFDACLTHHG
jgi:hypothetical protein